VPKTDYIELATGEKISILYEDRSVLAIDKPRGWMLVPASWQKTNRNLQMAITSSIAAKDFWARSRNLKFLRFVHRLDADTTGILLFAKSMGAVNTFGDLFESRKMDKTYLAVAHGRPKQNEWTCQLKLGPDLDQRGKMRVDAREGKEAENQIRVHLAESGYPIVGDEMYGSPVRKELGLRAIRLAFTDPFTKRPVQIRAPYDEFCRKYGFQNAKL
jgi:23S rRNA-/tRNA-specific pseudouridylate synthase